MEQNLSQYKIFYEVAKAGNISRAAKELYISQPAISKSISKLEDSLNTVLFTRNSRGVQLTDEEYYAHLCELAGDRPIAALIIDPSAASFAETVLRHGRYPVLKADNDVVAGIHRVSRALQQAQIKIAPGCKDTLREFSLYQWDNSLRRDAPKKENDHAMDDIRYFVSTVLNGEEPGGVCALAVERK